MTDVPTHYVVGLTEPRYRHPGAGRYPRFATVMGIPFLRTWARQRFFANPTLNAVERALVGQFSQSKDRDYPYSIGLFLQELSTLVAMWRHPGSTFHFVKGEVDVHHLPRWSRRTGARILVTYHDAPEFLELAGIDAQFLRNIDGVTVLCGTQRDYFAQYMDPRRIFVVPHGVAVDRFVPAPVRSRERTVVAVGSYCRDHVAFEDAVREVWAQDPTVRFLVVGTGTRPGESPRSFLGDHRVDYVDGISDEELVALYHRSAVAIVPVWAATANNALLEAMACGLPVVAPDLGGLPEYLGPDAGLLVEPLDGHALAEGILAVLADPDAADRMGAAGRRRAVECYAYPVVGALALAAYDTVRRWPQAPTEPTD